MIDIKETVRWLRAFAADSHGVTIKSEQQKCMMEAAKTIEWLHKGIQDYLDGSYIGPRSYRHMGAQTKCPHGKLYWDSCEGCIDDHFNSVMTGINGAVGSPSAVDK